MILLRAMAKVLTRWGRPELDAGRQPNEEAIRDEMARQGLDATLEDVVEVLDYLHNTRAISVARPTGGGTVLVMIYPKLDGYR